MLIDWFTVGAQAVNFLVLVWLLRRFLYAPILGAMNARQERVAAQIRDADQRETAAAQAAQQLAGERDAFDKDRQGLLDRASADAAALRSRLTDEARSEVERLRTTWADQLRTDQEQMRDQIAHGVQREALAIARSMLAQLAGRGLEQHVVDEFVRRLQALPPAERDAIASLAMADELVVVRSGFELTEEARRDLDATIHGLFGTTQPCQFEQSVDLVCGVELVSGGHKVAWSVGDALTALDDDVRELDAAARARSR